MKMRDWQKNVRQVVPYVPGEQPQFVNMIKLNTNENPYPPAPCVERLAKEMDMDDLRLYPNVYALPLVEELAKYHKIDNNQIFVGVGSDDVLAMSFLTFFNSQKPILFADITYSFYDVWAKLYHIPYERPCLDENFHLVKEDYYKENGGIIIANPNAPTSVSEDLVFIRDVIEHNRDVVVIVDEAYVDFGGQSALEMIREYDNLLVVRTFSKSRSMAGMRIGFAMGNPLLIQALNDVKFSFNSYTMNMHSIMLGAEAVKEEEYFRTTLQKIIDTREVYKTKLEELGFRCLDSKANFLFTTHASIPAQVLFEELRKKNIFVRYFNLPRIDNYLRITIGTEEEMSNLLRNIREIIGRKPL